MTPSQSNPLTPTTRLVLYTLTIGGGLILSSTGTFGLLNDTWAEWPVNLWCWAVTAWLFLRTDRRERVEIVTVVAIATPMELFFSEVWLIYEYQRGLMPLFVPVGHYFLFDAGRILAARLKPNWALRSLIPIVPLVAYGLWTGGDTSAIFLLLFVLAFTKWGPQPRLYAAMVWAALLMELVGTAVGAWTWAPVVPGTGLTAWNPPLLVGSFYCLGDLLVNLTVAKFAAESD